MCKKCCGNCFQDKEVEEMYSDFDRESNLLVENQVASFTEMCLVYSGLLLLLLAVWVGACYLVFHSLLKWF